MSGLVPKTATDPRCPARLSAKSCKACLSTPDPALCIACLGKANRLGALDQCVACAGLASKAGRDTCVACAAADDQVGRVRGGRGWREGKEGEIGAGRWITGVGRPLEG